MNKDTRLSTIARIMKARNSVQVVTATESEIKEEIKIAIRSNDNESVLDEDSNDLPSVELLARTGKKEDIDSARGASLHESGYLLNKREKVELARDLAEYKKKFWIVPSNFFSPAF
jgi:hypothetical protein